MTNAGKKLFATIKTKHLLIFLYFLFLLFMCIYAFKKPTYGWDTLPYMGIVLSYDTGNINFIHDTVYEIAKQQMPVEIYKQLTDTLVAYRKKMAEDALAFHDQFPFYIVKPLYTGIAYLFYKSGISLLKALVIPSFIAYFLMGCLLFFWLQTYLHILFSLTASFFIMLLSPVLTIFKGCSPDCLASFLLLTAFYFIIEKKSLAVAFLFLLLSVFARLENIIPGFFILSLLAYTNKWKERIGIKKYLFMLAVLMICYLFITSNVLKYGWGILYYPSFANHLNVSYEANSFFSLKEYFILFYAHLASGLLFSNLIVFILLALVVFIDEIPLQFQKISFEQLLIIVVILSLITRFILQPLIDDRFYVAYYICIIVLLIRKCAGLIVSKKLDIR